MTNGEKIKEVFGVKDEQINEGVMFVTIDGLIAPKIIYVVGMTFLKIGGTQNTKSQPSQKACKEYKAESEDRE